MKLSTQKPWIKISWTLMFCARMDEHVPNIKRYVCMVKECTRSRYNSLPFEWILHLMLIWLTANTVFWLNAFPCSNGVSDTLSLRYLTTGKHLDYQKHVHHEFSIYVQTHKSHTNDMWPQTIGAICLAQWEMNREVTTACHWQLDAISFVINGWAAHAKWCNHIHWWTGVLPEDAKDFDICGSFCYW
jgi:hypothetical protein